MNVRQIIDHFTHKNFTLILLDGGYEVYNGPACDIEYEPEASYPVIAIEPPKHANEVVLHVDGTDYFEYDDTVYDYDTADV